MPKPLTDANRLSIQRPHLVAEWDIERNGTLAPTDVSFGSGKIVHWSCSTYAHQWMAKICSRSEGKGCPACSGRAVSDANRLSIQRPHLAAEWDVERNGTLTPADVSFGSEKIVHWLCSACAYRWTARINSRSNGNGCHACSGYVVSNANRLSIQRPHLAAEWDVERNGTLTPADVSFGSDKIVYWVCSTCTHRWTAQIGPRSKGNGCPACSGNVPSDANRLSIQRPHLAAEWDVERNGTLTPADVSFGSEKNVQWSCSTCGHRWTAQINSRSSGRGCSACSGNVVSDANRLSIQRPHLAAEWNVERNGTLTPANVSFGSKKIIHWSCSTCAHQWMAQICSRSSGKGCPACATRIFGSGTSRIEVAITAEFAHIFGDGTLASVRGKRLETTYASIDALHATSFVRTNLSPDIAACDVFIDGNKFLVVEWDGAYTHSGDDQQRRDRSKTAHLEALGHVVVRLREAPLATLTLACVCVEATPYNSEPRIKATVDAALRHVRERYGALLTARSTRAISEYLASAQTQNQDAAAAYLAHTEATTTATTTTTTTQTTLDAFLAGDATNERPTKRMRIDDGGGGGGGG